MRHTEAGQIPVTAIPVFPSLMKSMAYDTFEISSLSKKVETSLMIVG